MAFTTTLADPFELANELAAAVAADNVQRTLRLLHAGVHPQVAFGTISPVHWAALNRNYELMAVLFLFGAPTGQEYPYLHFPLPVWRLSWPEHQRIVPLEFAARYAPGRMVTEAAHAQRLGRLVVTRQAPRQLWHLTYWSVRHASAFPPPVQQLVRTVYLANQQTGALPVELLEAILGHLTAVDGASLRACA